MPFRSRTALLWRFTVVGKNEAYLDFHVKYPTLLPIPNLNFLDRFNKIFPYKISRKSVHGAALIHAERWKNGHTNRQTDGEAEMRKVKGAFREYANASEKWMRWTKKSWPCFMKTHYQRISVVRRKKSWKASRKKRKDRHTQKKGGEKSITCFIAAKCTVQCPTDNLIGRTRPCRKQCKGRRDRPITSIPHSLCIPHLLRIHGIREDQKVVLIFAWNFFMTAAIVWQNANSFSSPHALHAVCCRS